MNDESELQSVFEVFFTSMEKPLEDALSAQAAVLGKSLEELTDDEILVTADTMVVCDGEMMGKPHGKEEAEHMLRTLSGREHQVITAVTVRDNKRRKTVSDCANVWFKNLTDSEISYYIGKWKPFDKAGAYGIQEWIGYIGIEKIEGSFFNIMGLPVHLLYSLLLEFVG